MFGSSTGIAGTHVELLLLVGGVIEGWLYKKGTKKGIYEALLGATEGTCL